MNINKADFINGLASNMGVSKRAAADALEAVLQELTTHLANYNKVTFMGFGSFSVSHRDARTGRNPATGAAVEIPASSSVKFKPGTTLEHAVNQGG